MRPGGRSSRSSSGAPVSNATRGDELAGALGRRLGGTVHGLHRLSGGASRVTSAFDLESDGGRRPLILQVERGRGPTAGHDADRARPARGGRTRRRPGPERRRPGRGRRHRPGLAGGRAARGRDHPPQDPARRRPGPMPARALAAQCGRALAAIHAIEPDRVAGLPRADPLRDPLPLLDALGEVRPALELGARWLAAHRPEPGPRVTVHGDFRCGNLLVDAAGCAACSTGSWPTPATRPRTSDGSARRPGASAARARWAASAGSTSCSTRTAARAAR